MRIILYSALFGDYDIVRPLCDVGCEAVMFTDHPHPESAGSWIVDTSHIDTVKEWSHPRLKAKWFKLHPHELFKEYDVSIWLDASWIVESPFFVKELVSMLDGFVTFESDIIAKKYDGYPIAFFPHRWRKTVRDELAAHLPIPKYWGLPLEKQVASYFADGFRDDLGLMECTCIPARHNDARVKAFYDLWWEQNVKWSYADQLSAPYCAWKTQLPFTWLPQDLDHQKWFRLAAWSGNK